MGGGHCIKGRAGEERNQRGKHSKLTSLGEEVLVTRIADAEVFRRPGKKIQGGLLWGGVQEEEGNEEGPAVEGGPN